MDKKRKPGVKDWTRKHAKYINEFKATVDALDWQHSTSNGVAQEEVPPHNAAAFDVYLSWLTPRTRLRLLPLAYKSEDIFEALDPHSCDAAELDYNKSIREHAARRELAPVFNYVVRSCCFITRTNTYNL